MELSPYISLLRKCSSTKNLLEGMRLHNAFVISASDEHNCNVENRLVQMYGECGSLENAISVFMNMPECDIVSRTIMIKVLMENGRPLEGFQKLRQMELEGTVANNVSFITTLAGCNNPLALEEGKRLHARIVAMALDADVVLSTALINMYNKCESVNGASKVFDSMTERTEISWNVIIAGHVRAGKYTSAMNAYKQMQSEGSLPTKVTFVSLLSAYNNSIMMDFGDLKRMHACLSDGMVYDVVVGTVLVNMYTKMGDLDEARQVFEMILEPNAVSWNAIIAATLELGQRHEGLRLFQQMLLEGNTLDRFNLATVLAACASQEDLVQGRHVHARVRGSQLESDLMVGNALINLHGKCGRLKDAQLFFECMPCRDTVSYNSLLAAHVHEEQSGDALQLFNQMRLEGVLPDNITLSTVLSACTYEETFAEGMRVHAVIQDGDMLSDEFLSTSLVSMYGKSSDLDSAVKVLNRSKKRDVVIWTALISSCAQHGLTEKGFHLYRQMLVEGVIPNKATITSVLDACASQTDLYEGRRLHSCVTAHDLGAQISVTNAVINMYTKSGNLDAACDVFGGMRRRDVVTWTAMIAGHARLGHGVEAHKLFRDMNAENISPNKITFINILDACSRAGLVDEAYFYFACMSGDYGIDPTLEHYNCMIDLLGRAGRLCEGEALILGMRSSAPAMLWLTLLSACRCHMDMELASRAAHGVLGLEPKNEVTYEMLSSMYAALGEWEEASKFKILARCIQELS